ncbi:MAG: hypothetical protein R3F20_03620 [Planctomycetota bacterium]
MSRSLVPGLILALLVGGGLGAQATILVPQHHPDPASALAAASDGDLILVAPGVYPGGLDFLGKAVELRSLLGPSVTVIDGAGLPAAVRIDSSETVGAILDGFSIVNAVDTVGDSTTGGSGLVCAGSPRIRNCRFTGCRGSGHGGAVVIRPTPSGQHASPRFEDCCFLSNSVASDGTFIVGGAVGVFCDSIFGGVHVTFVRCDFTLNSCEDSNGGSSRGGAVGATTSGALVEIAFEDCLFVANHASDESPDATPVQLAFPGRGGAIGWSSTDPSPTRCASGVVVSCRTAPVTASIATAAAAARSR